MTGNDSQLFATGVYGVVKTAACFVFLVFVVDSLGRRWSLLWTAAAQGTFLYIVGIYGRVQPPIKGEPVSGRALCPSLPSPWPFLPLGRRQFLIPAMELGWKWNFESLD
jgi:hypothetical protein